MIVEVPPRGRGGGFEVHDLDVSGNIPPSGARRRNLTGAQYLRRLSGYFKLCTIANWNNLICRRTSLQIEW